MSGFVLSDVIGLFRELNDLKRIHAAGRTGSIATRLFEESWAALMSGRGSERVAKRVTTRSLAAARLGDLDRALLLSAGVSGADAERVERDAVSAIAGAMLPRVQDVIDHSLAAEPAQTIANPAFVAALADQPRAGITCPGKPRIILEPPENHADHCLAVAVYGVLLSPVYGASPGRVFLAGLAHHFHNAGMPDAGFTGEMLLGPNLATIVKHHTMACLEQLPHGLRADVEDALAILPDTKTAEGKAFHAADVLDRVLQLQQYMRASTITSQQMLGEMELVHEGPVKFFQVDVLRQAGLS